MYLRKIVLVTDVAVLNIDTIKVVFQSIILKQFHFLKPLDIFMTLLKLAKKIKLRTRKSMSTKSVSRYKKLLSDNANYFSLSYKTFSRALNYAQDFGTTVKESLKRTTNSKWATLTKSRIVSCQILLCLFQQLSTMSLPSV